MPMSDDEINRFIAEKVCGWQIIYDGLRMLPHHHAPIYWDKAGVLPQNFPRYEYIWKPATSLDDCAIAEAYIDDEMCVAYLDALKLATNGSLTGMVRATARQRCEAMMNVYGGEA